MGRVRIDGACHDPFQRLGNGRLERAQGGGRLMHARKHLGHRIAVHPAAAAAHEHVVNHQPPRVDVGSLIDGLAARLCASPTETKAKGGLQFFFRRLLAGEPRLGAAH